MNYAMFIDFENAYISYQVAYRDSTIDNLAAIKTVFAFDEHYRQYGRFIVVPSWQNKNLVYDLRKRRISCPRQ